MNAAKVIDDMLDDLRLVAESLPNERLPKEEQVRCSIYMAIRPLYHVVCAERGYRCIDEGGRTECDGWARSSGAMPVWIEFKRCWSVKGWNNKPPEQRRDWEADLEKLRGVPIEDERYFILVGLFDFDPLNPSQPDRSGVVINMREFHPAQLVHSGSRRFSWRKDDGISWAGAWVWRWPSRVVIL